MTCYFFSVKETGEDWFADEKEKRDEWTHSLQLMRILNLLGGCRYKIYKMTAKYWKSLKCI